MGKTIFNFSYILVTSTDASVNTMWCSPAMDYYSAVKRNKVLTHTTTCTHLENITPSKSHRRPHTM